MVIKAQYTEEELEQILKDVVVEYIKKEFGIKKDPIYVSVLIESNNAYVQFDEEIVSAYRFYKGSIDIVTAKGKNMKIGAVEITDLVKILPKEYQKLPIFEDFLLVDK